MAENTQNDGVKNFMSDIRYKLMLRAQAELEMTQSVVDGDNPWGCTAAELTSWKAYRKAWCDLARSDLSSVSIVMQNDMMLGGIDVPEVPDGWDFIVRAEDDLPPVLTRTNIDGYDPDSEVQASQTQDQSGVA
tara:strand:+ start:22 stop:420 length:399 start_codon:yes stop_codon:yes gene_type:complete